MEDFHAYFVSELGVWVHNTCPVSEGGSDVNPNALKYNGDGTWTSNEGLIYGQSQDGNRVIRVLKPKGGELVIEICPYCEQGNVIYARIKDNSHIYRFCPECDTIWHDKIDDKFGQGLKSFLESKGYDYPSDQIEIIDELQ